MDLIASSSPAPRFRCLAAICQRLSVLQSDDQHLSRPPSRCIRQDYSCLSRDRSFAIHATIRCEERPAPSASSRLFRTDQPRQGGARRLLGWYLCSHRYISAHEPWGDEVLELRNPELQHDTTRGTTCTASLPFFGRWLTPSLRRGEAPVQVLHETLSAASSCVHPGRSLVE